MIEEVEADRRKKGIIEHLISVPSLIGYIALHRSLLRYWCEKPRALESVCYGPIL